MVEWFNGLFHPIITKSYKILWINVFEFQIQHSLIINICRAFVFQAKLNPLRKRKRIYKSNNTQKLYSSLSNTFQQQSLLLIWGGLNWVCKQEKVFCRNCLEKSIITGWLTEYMWQIMLIIPTEINIKKNKQAANRHYQPCLSNISTSVIW